MSQSYSAYLNSIGTKIHTLPRLCGFIKIQIARHILRSIHFKIGVVLFAKVCFFTSAV